KTQLDAAMKLDPFSVSIQSFHALELLYERRREEATGQWRDLAKASPSFVPAHFWLWHVFHILDGRDQEALEQAKATFAGSGDTGVERGLRRGYAEAGYPGAMRQAVSVLEAQARMGRPDSFAIATTYVHLGEKSQALTWLEKGFDAAEINTTSWLGLPIFDS